MQAADSDPPPVLIGAKPRPRVLVLGYDDEVVERLREFIPTVGTAHDGFSGVRQKEWDAVVTRFVLDHAAEHLFAVVQAPDSLSAAWTIESRGSIQGDEPHLDVRLAGRSISSELLRHGGLPARIEQLAHEVLEPMVKARHLHERFLVHSFRHEANWQPFLSTADNEALAGRYNRTSGAEAWVLPSDIPDIVPWVRAAVAEWNKVAPDCFPGVPDWSHEPQWQTGRERQHAAALVALDVERQRINDELDQRAAAVRAQLDDARREADSYERALLTADSGELVDAVTRALRELGFDVIDADEHAKPGDNLEDLHVTDPHQPGWLAIAEVKGYTKGASTTAFQQLARFSKRYLQRTGTSPSSEWYIANQFRKYDPAIRQPILHGKTEDVHTFAADNGLIIDTLVLFRTLDLVRAGGVTAKEVRGHMRASTGVLLMPATGANAI